MGCERVGEEWVLRPGPSGGGGWGWWLFGDWGVEGVWGGGGWVYWMGFGVMAGGGRGLAEVGGGVVV